ncbi:thioester reductase domain-containing protein [Leptothoe sp. ISB3NOV94-8A]
MSNIHSTPSPQHQPDGLSATSLSATKRALIALREMRAELQAVKSAQTEPIAIIGMGCRFPGGVNSPDEFWQLLQQGQDAVGPIPSDRWPGQAATYETTTSLAGLLDQVDSFDAQFFGITPREARNLDPQQRLLLEVSWEALEQAHQVPHQLRNSATGVFVGISSQDYANQLLAADEPVDTYSGTGNAFSTAAGRLSYQLGLTGPSLAVDTACSSSLVAVHLACQSLRQRECILALAGGVNLLLDSHTHEVLSQTGMVSPGGPCRTFDAGANGYARGEGCGVIVLKRLSDALADGDPIQAILRGSTTNQNGHRGGLTAPNGPAQVEVIRQALANSGVDHSQISYVEVQGTGTPLGDSIEVNALGEIFPRDRTTAQFLHIGSVKTNIGHLEAAAGIASVIKVVLQLQHRQIVPHLHCQTPNPHIDWDTLPVTVPESLTPWDVKDDRRMAGVSAFGFSGTNAHVIVEEVGKLKSEVGSRKSENQSKNLLTLSAKSKKGLETLVSQYGQHLERYPEQGLADICCGSQVGRSHFTHRLAIRVTDRQGLMTALQQLEAGQTSAQVQQWQLPKTNYRPNITFLFTGDGAQYSGMGQQLYETYPVFRQALDQCTEVLRPHYNLLEILYPDLLSSESGQGFDGELSRTAQGQPLQSPSPSPPLPQTALFAFEYALAQLWQSWGIQPNQVMGYGLGEFVAACVAGVFSLADGLQLIAQWDQWWANITDRGQALTVLAPVSQCQTLLASYGASVEIVAYNSPNHFVLSGATATMADICDALEDEGLLYKCLETGALSPHWVQSSLLTPLLAKFRQAAENISYACPQIPLVSTINGTLVGDEVATPDYWSDHFLQPIQFTAGIRTLYEQTQESSDLLGPEQALEKVPSQNGKTHSLTEPLFLEMGPKPLLIGMGQQCISSGIWLPSLYPSQSDKDSILQNLGSLYVQGAAVNWQQVNVGVDYQKVDLPTYPWQRQRHWFQEPKTDIQDKSLSDRRGAWPCAPSVEMSHARRIPDTSYLPFQIFCLSAATEAELFTQAEATVKRLQTSLDLGPKPDLAAICFEANTYDSGARSRHPHRLAVIVQSAEELHQTILQFLAGQDVPNVLWGQISSPTSADITFLFGGFQWPYRGAGYELYQTQPVFREAIQRCDAIVQSLLGGSLLDYLYSANKSPNETAPTTDQDMVYAMPVIFTLQYALYELWKSWGITPSLLLGASFGEYTVAHVAGVIDLDDTLHLLASFGQALKGVAPTHQAVIVNANEAVVTEAIKPVAQEVSIIVYAGACNLISGEPAAMEAVIQHLSDQQVATIDLQLTYGFHTQQLQTPEVQNTPTMADISLSPPQLKVVSSLTGELVDQVLTTSNYWTRMALEPAQFSKAIHTCLHNGCEIFLGVSDDAASLSMGRASVPPGTGLWLASLREKLSDWKQLLRSLGELYIRGVPIDWAGFYQGYPQRQVMTDPLSVPALSPVMQALQTGHLDALVHQLSTGGIFSPAEQQLLPKLLRQLSQQYRQELFSKDQPDLVVSAELPRTHRSQQSILAQLDTASSAERQQLLSSHIQTAIAQIMELPPAQVSLLEPLGNLGLDSLMALELKEALESTLRVDIPLGQLVEGVTIAGLARFIDDARDGTTVEATDSAEPDLEAEAILEPAIDPTNPALLSVSDPLHAEPILLSGATGLVGAHLLAELLQQTTVDIYCLIRAQDAAAAQQKLKRQLETFGLWQPWFNQRIVPVVGDLSAPWLGLSAEVFQQLAENIGVIYHSGAWVNHVYPYSTLKATNVLGTVEMLRLACTHRVKPVHFVSTLWVFMASAYTDDQEPIREEDPLLSPKGLKHGYLQSKWVAEKLVETARDRGLPTSIYRLGIVTGNSQTGVGNNEDLFSRMIKGCVQLGQVPALPGVFSNYVPVDYVAQAIAQLSLQPMGSTFHLLHPQSIPTENLFQWLSSFGYTLKKIPLDQWVAILKLCPENSLYPYMVDFREDLLNLQKAGIDFSRINTQNTAIGLANSGLSYPLLDETLLKTYVTHWRQNDFLPKADSIPVP